MESGKTRAAANKAVRQEALREQLSAQGHVQHVVDISTKLANLDIEIDSNSVHRLKAAADIKLKLIAKYAPDLKAIEHTGEIGNRDASEFTDDELLSIATSGSTGTTKQADSKKVANKVH